MLNSHITMVVSPENPRINVQEIGPKTKIRTSNGEFEVSSLGHEVVLFAPDDTRQGDPLYNGRDATEGQKYS